MKKKKRPHTNYTSREQTYNYFFILFALSFGYTVKSAKFEPKKWNTKKVSLVQRNLPQYYLTNKEGSLYISRKKQRKLNEHGRNF